jgi:enoyl-CoA hydratase
MDLRAFRETGERPEVPGRGLAFTRTPPKTPLIAAVEGMALAGGFELVLTCDLVVASDTAMFGFPEVAIGLIAGSGGLLRLSRRIPTAIAMEYALTGARMPATVAYEWGLVNRLVAPGTALDAAIELAEQIGANAPLALQATKDLVGRATALNPVDVADQDAILETLATSPDALEGVAAFAEKRRPVWGSSK